MLPQKILQIIVLVISIIIWSVVGFILWIPLLFRVVFTYVSMVTSSMFFDISLIKIEKALHTATTFYVDGFSRIYNSFQQSRQNQITNKKNLSFGESLIVIMNVLYSILFWYILKEVQAGNVNRLIENFLSIFQIFKPLFS